MNKAVNEVIDKGYVVIPNVLTAKECDRFMGLVNKIYEKYAIKYPKDEKSVKKFHGADTVKMIYNLHNKDLDFMKLIDHPRVTPIIKTLLQIGSYNQSEPFILKLSTARSPFGKAKKQQLHIDSGIPGSPFPLVIQTIWALDNFTKKNGSTRVVPESHKKKEFAKDGKTYPNETSLNIPKGAVVIYNGGLWHGGGEKETEGDRWAVINTYARWFFKPTFDYNKNTPKKIFNRLTDFQKELLGFKFNPAADEFTRLSRRSEDFEKPAPYTLPK
jgi:ectoine hydroxylase-related dioxygenase (phytanoyl-CoA dioxygenase family)